MPDMNPVFSRWKGEYDFRTFVNSAGSVLVTAAFAAYNGFLGVSHGSAWHCGICIYYVLLILVRCMVLLLPKGTAAGKAGRESGTDGSRVLLIPACLLFLINLSLVVPFVLMVMQERPVVLTLIPALAMAVYTTYKVTVSALNLKRKNASSNLSVRFLRVINFMDALVSIATLQNTLIMVSARGDRKEMLPLTAVSSVLLWAATVYLSVMILRLVICRSHGQQAERK